MTKLQWSKKYNDGTILVAGGDDIDEFRANYGHMLTVETGLKLHSAAPAQVTQQSTGETFTAKLPDNATLTITWKGDKYFGEVDPFPGTKYPVKMWPEVIDTLHGFDPKDGVLDMTAMEVSYVKNDKGYPMKITSVM